ncbi:hypothetical protein SPFL3102_00396 [Sporomusaceae bacterium FL31]|nr:hypothetical protein SPFL3101_01888 [Sporomusaceae bacterium FL31]GCE32607.1 hypothetical protein SPFL3102_00396 [Sporomusaceae bacterium]
MSTKIKSIELESFRAYKEKQIFDFTTSSGKLANLVVLYAPNGFGKTSLYDAVEWSLTGKINRIQGNRVIKTTADNEKGYILKNKDTSCASGRVKISDEWGESIELRTKQLDARRKTDYCAGDLIRSTSKYLEEISGTNISDTNILSHDKIDAFLLFSLPHERYNTLSKFWDYTSDTEIYKALQSLNREADTYKATIEEQLIVLDNDIAKLSTPKIDIVTFINQLSDLGVKLLPVEKNPTTLALDSFINDCLNNRAQVNQRLRDHLANNGSIEYLKENYPTYRLNLVEYKNNLNKHKKLTELQQKQISITANETLLLQKNNLLDKIEKDINHYATLVENQTLYAESLRQINIIKNENANLTVKISELSKDIQAKTAEQTITDKKIKNLDQDLEILEKNKESIYEQIKKHLYITENLTTNEIKVKKYNKLLQLRDEKIYRLQRTIRNYKSILNKNQDDYSLDEILQKLFPELINQVNSHKDIILAKNDQLKNLQKNFNDYGQLGSDLNNIIKSGKVFIEKVKCSTCPLCHAEYSNFEQLIDKVNRSIPDFLSLDLKSKEIDIVKIDINNLTEELSIYYEKIRELLKEATRKHEEILEKLQLKNAKTEHKKHKIININFSWSNDLETLKNNFSMLSVEIEEINQKSIDQIKELITARIHSVLTKKAQFLDIMKQLEIDINIKTEESKNYSEIISSNKITLDKIEANPEYLTIKHLLEELQIQFDPAIISSRLDNMKKTQVDLVGECTKLKNLILVFKKDLEKYPIDQLNNLISSENQNKLEKESWINYYQQKYYEISGIRLDDITLANLEEFSLSLANKVHECELSINLIDKITEQVEYIKKNNQRLEKEQEKHQKQIELTTIKKTLLKLNITKNNTQELILNKVNKAFNLDVINEIYSRIDPHPDLKLVKFRPTFNNERPELEIYGEKSNEELTHPILYFSSAQIDILSLSIFLAQALNPGRSQLNTIFMDDPINHMDSINVLSFIDLLRTITTTLDRQVILSTHNENLYKLIQRKIDPLYYSSKFIELSSYGKLK